MKSKPTLYQTLMYQRLKQYRVSRVGILLKRNNLIKRVYREKERVMIKKPTLSTLSSIKVGMSTKKKGR